MGRGLCFLVLLGGCLTSPKEYQELWDYSLDHDGDGYTNAEWVDYDGDDCDDEDATVYPEAPELCDGLDNDCDGVVDEGRADWEGLYRDLDADGYGDPERPVLSCPLPEDAVGVAGDCDDSLPAINPAQTDLVGDALDQNCDGVDGTDQDGDGWASVASGGEDCEDRVAEAYPGGVETWYDGVDGDCDGGSDFDADADGWDASPEGPDCDDSDPAVFPGGQDSWYDGVDGDCDGASDYDADADGFDSADYGGEDCDDADAARSPAAAEAWYDGVDGDCDGASDYDADADGYESDAHGGEDCDDGDPAVSPAATETWYDGVDGDCDGGSDFDADGDGYDVDSAGGQDCDDTTSGIRPGVGETWYDGVDANCDGLSDYDADVDGQDADSYGGQDCDDRDASTYTGASERCDGVDRDCNGTVDDDYAVNALTWYTDNDGDGFGNPNAPQTACSQPSGTDSSDTDCDDSDSSVYPNAPEQDYGQNDADCDGLMDEMLVSGTASYTVRGENIHDGLASALLMSPDLNGDGDPELIMGCELGSNWTFDGGVIGFMDVGQLGSGGTLGDSYSYAYGDDNDQLGHAIVLLGDVDQDGYDEVAVSAPLSDAGGSNSGSVYIFDVGTSATHASGTQGILPDSAITGSHYDTYLGESLSAGDMDGDGLLDLAMGEPGGLSTRGHVFVNLATHGYYSGSDVIFVYSHAYFYGPVSGTLLGTAISLTSDLTNNGYDDLVACGGTYNTDAGRCWLIEGSATPTYYLKSPDDYALATITGQASESLGLNPDGLRTDDVDGDGTADLIVTSSAANAGGGIVYVFFGGTGLSGSYSTGADEDIAITGDGSLGVAIQAGDDVDADGAADLLLGAPTAGASTEGVVYLLTGPLSAGSYTLPDDQAASWTGSATDDLFGSVISNALDLDGDGTAEFAVAAPGDDSDRVNKGLVSLIPTY